ncbi:MAG: host attachment protein [Bacillota bacterium]
MNTQPILVLVGDRGRARLFELDHDEPQMAELEDLVNPGFRLHERELSGDRQGRVFNRIRRSRATLGEAHVHKRLGAERFARTVAGRVLSRCRAGAYARVFLVAEPEFMGLLRPQLEAGRLKAPLSRISKNLTRHPAAEIRGHLPQDPWKRRAL